MEISAGALLLVAGSSLAWTGVDLSRKLLVDRVRPVPLAFLFTAAAVPLFGVWIAVDGLPRVAPGYAVPMLASVAFNVAANLLFFAALRISPLSVTIPLLSLTPVFTALLGIPLLGEIPSAVQGLGILLVVAGAFALSLPAGEPFSVAAVLRSWRGEKGAAAMVLVAFFWSLTVPLDKLATERSSGPFHGAVLCAGVAAAILAVLVAQGRLGEVAAVRRDPRVVWLFAAGVLVSVLALGLQLLAIQRVWVGLMETLKRGLGNVSAVVLGRLLFGEAVTLRKVAAVVLMAAGVALILGWS